MKNFRLDLLHAGKPPQVQRRQIIYIALINLQLKNFERVNHHKAKEIE